MQLTLNIFFTLLLLVGFVYGTTIFLVGVFTKVLEEKAREEGITGWWLFAIWLTAGFAASAAIPAILKVWGIL